MGSKLNVLPWDLEEFTPPPSTDSLSKVIQAARDGLGGDFVAALFAPSAGTPASGTIQDGFAGFDFPVIEFEQPEQPAELPAAPAKPTIVYQTWMPGEFGDAEGRKDEATAMPDVDTKEYQDRVEAILAEARAQAELIIQGAQAQAVNIIRQAETRSNEVMQQAQQNASEVTGNAYNTGLAMANSETVELLHTARSIVEEVQAWRDGQFAQGEMMMLRLVIEIAQSIFGDGLPLDPENLGQAFSRALSEAKTLGDLRIYVHPEDAAALGANWAQLQSSISGQRMDLIASDIIKRGGCFVEGQYGSVDGRVETQLRIVKDTLLSTFATAEAVQS